jgi:cyclopropane-fatty-acyl-phospholipid synthase
MSAFLYNGLIEHHRRTPRDHQFSYPLYIYGFDLEDLPELDRSLPFFGHNRFRPASVHDKDYLDSGPGTIREKLDRFLAKEGFGDAVARAFLITSPRYFNYVFNPVSFYYLFRADGALVGNVAEVNNTFGEKHLYILHSPGRRNDDRTATYRTKKAFHVSPFNRIEGTYEFSFADISKELDVGINIRQEGEVVFEARLRGSPEPLTASSQMKMFLRHPIAPHLSVPRILFEAAKLSFGKKLAYNDKPVPLSPMTIRTNPPTFVQRKCMGAAFDLFGRAGRGALRMTLPDGTVKTFGEATSADQAEMTVKDWQFFSRAVIGGDIGFGESYMHDEWDSPDLKEALQWFVRNRDSFFGRYQHLEPLFDRLNRILYPIVENTVNGSKKNIVTHYDLGNEFFQVFLDPSMTYSCARYLNGKDTLEEAQKNKLQAMIRKAAIGPDNHVLEIGCGWGSFAVEAVRTTGCRLTGVTISDAQYEYARERIRREGLEDRVEIVLRDYREIKGPFDRIVSIEMLEAVGHKYFETFFERCDRLLKPGGVMALQFISIPDRRYEHYRKGHDWIRKHIFPGGELPSLAVVMEALARQTCFNVQSVENIGPDYALTLRDWRSRFLAGIDRVTAQGFDRTFQRKWVYYLAGCEACFSTGYLGDLQMVMVKSEIGY